MDYTNIRQIHEIIVFSYSTRAEQLVNAYLARGWVLLSIQQRSNTNGTTTLQSVYVVGHSEAGAEHPAIETAEHLAEHCEAKIQHRPGAFLWG